MSHLIDASSFRPFPSGDFWVSGSVLLFRLESSHLPRPFGLSYIFRSFIVSPVVFGRKEIAPLNVYTLEEGGGGEAAFGGQWVTTALEWRETERRSQT